jgi:hypothetical protein
MTDKLQEVIKQAGKPALLTHRTKRRCNAWLKKPYGNMLPAGQKPGHEVISHLAIQATPYIRRKDL